MTSNDRLHEEHLRIDDEMAKTVWYCVFTVLAVSALSTLPGMGIWVIVPPYISGCCAAGLGRWDFLQHRIDRYFEIHEPGEKWVSWRAKHPATNWAIPLYDVLTLAFFLISCGVSTLLALDYFTQLLSKMVYLVSVIGLLASSIFIFAKAVTWANLAEK